MTAGVILGLGVAAVVVAGLACAIAYAWLASRAYDDFEGIDYGQLHDAEPIHDFRVDAE